ncbi:MAG TPA: MraY family glycosyltransferase [Actinomycetota bacterium]|nr:MraY family glycosyltransferase [Actinomycetota bacterium]
MIAPAPPGGVAWPNLHPYWIQVAVALPVAAVLGFVVRAVGPRVGALDHPDAELKPHERAVSYLGGLAVAGGVAAGIATHGWPLPLGASVALGGAVALGLADDALRVPPVVRLIVQVGLGAALVLWGWSPDTPDGFLMAVPYVVFFVAALNAVNMVDGMDGLAGTLAVLSAAGIAAVGETATHHRPAMLAVCLAAAAGGFLVHNLPPARLFLGDNGAYLVGAALAVAAFQVGNSVAALAGATGCLGVFLLDLVLSILRRLTGRVPMHRGDRSHLYDQLRARGRSVWGTLAVCAGAQVAFVAAGVIAANLPKVGAVVVEGAVWAAAVGALFAFGFVTARTPARVR